MSPRIGFALSLVTFAASIFVAALLITVLQDPMEQILFAGGEVTSSNDAERGFSWVEMAWDATPIVVMFLGFVQLVAAAAVRSRGPT